MVDILRWKWTREDLRVIESEFCQFDNEAMESSFYTHVKSKHDETLLVESFERIYLESSEHNSSG